jgi:dihydroorotase
MPNLAPCPDTKENLDLLLSIIQKDAIINVHPYGTITKSQSGDKLSDMQVMSDYVCAFSDDGKGVQTPELMQSAMNQAKQLGKIIAAHCEDNSLLFGGYIHDGQYAKAHSHKGICSESEWKQIERDIELVKITGCKYHVCHISTKESVALIRKAKKDGVDITCETAPHYLIFNDMDLQEDARFKMNPPIREEADRLALLDGIKDGTIDMIATDHAPHSAQEKSQGLEKSLMGVVGLETSFPALYTHLVKTRFITLEHLITLMSVNPSRRFNLNISEGDFSVWDLDKEYTVNPDEFLSMGKSSPFTGTKLFGRCLMTVKNNKIVYTDPEFLQRISK